MWMATAAAPQLLLPLLVMSLLLPLLLRLLQVM